MSSLDPLYYNDHIRLLFQHKLQWWRSFLGLFAGLHFASVAGHLVYDLMSRGPNFTHLKVLDTLVALLAVASRVTWRLLFRDPHKFLHFHRPSKGYRWAVYIVSAAATIPSLILHILIIFVSSKIKQLEYIGFGHSVLQLFLLLAVSSLYLWMVQRFLLSENDERYEPTVPFLRTRTVSASSSRRQSVSSAVALEPYSDSFTSSSSYESHLASDGRLSKAYAMQWASDPLRSCELDEDFHGQGSGATETEPTPKPKDTSPSDPSESTTSGSTDNQPTSPLRCRTVARFDYMCQNRIGPHSWISYPLVPVVLGIYSTILFGLVSILIYEDKHSRSPSPKARYGLLAPVGGYWFCRYAIKRGLRKSLFSRSHISLPEPWIEVTSLFGKPVIINSDTGTSTSVDPRLRAFPIEGQDRRAGTRSSKYMKAYNASPSTCKEYWGHLGREWTTRYRSRPTTSMLFSLGFTSFQFSIGVMCIFSYPFNVDKVLELPDITIPDKERILRIMHLKLVLMLSTAPLILLIVVYASSSMISILVLCLTERARRAKGTSSLNVT